MIRAACLAALLLVTGCSDVHYFGLPSGVNVNCPRKTGGLCLGSDQVMYVCADSTPAEHDFNLICRRLDVQTEDFENTCR